MTTASLHREMAEALRAAGGLRFGECPACRHRISKCDKNPIWGDETCSGHRARAALEDWEKREPLRKNAELLHAVYGPLYRATGVGVQEGAWLAGEILDALEPLLYGERG